MKNTSYPELYMMKYFTSTVSWLMVAVLRNSSWGSSDGKLERPCPISASREDSSSRFSLGLGQGARVSSPIDLEIGPRTSYLSFADAGISYHPHISSFLQGGPPTPSKFEPRVGQGVRIPPGLSNVQRQHKSTHTDHSHAFILADLASLFPSTKLEETVHAPRLIKGSSDSLPPLKAVVFGVLSRVGCRVYQVVVQPINHFPTYA